MPTVIPVRMHFSSQDLWFNPRQTGAVAGDHVIVTTERGTEIGLATRDAFEAPKDEVKGQLKPVLRVATEEDLALADELAERGEAAMHVFRSMVKERNLDMKPVGVEFLFGGEKAVFYFAAEDRVDFRDLVRDLTAHFHQRVDMRQIGVRDEARLVGGYAPCGQELCCVRFGGEFEPVSIRMAKEQDLPLNSSKISGVCGRLMCCLRYEFEAYRDFKSRAPKRNALIDTPLGKAKVVEYNTPRETVVLRLENGKSFTVALKDMTCSEGCCKRAAEQHTPLRPDTVTREALEALGTPEIVMQLANLDRALEQGNEALETRRTPRRHSAQAAEATPEAAEKPRGETRGRRRGKDAAKPEAEKTREASPSEDGKQEQQGQERNQPRGGGMRPRRTRGGEGGAGQDAKKAATNARGERSERGENPRPARTNGRNAAAASGETGGEQQRRATRRHHTAAGDATQQAERRNARSGGEGTPAREGGETRRQRSGGGRDRSQQGQNQGQGQSEGRNREQGQGQGQQRRRHRTAGGEAGSAPRERRNRSDASGSTGSDAAPQQPRPRRRPGDRGGAGGQGGAANGSQGTE